LKLTPKLTLAFLLVSLIVIGLAATFIAGKITAEFNQYLEDQRQNEFANAAKDYYLTNHTWDGVDAYLRDQRLLPPLEEVNPPPQPYVLVDSHRVVIVASAPYVVGQKVKQGELDKGIPVESNGQIFGTVISTGKPLVKNPIDQKYIDQITQALWIAAAGGIVISLLLGWLLARSLTRPVRELTDATRGMARGQLDQQVPVRSADELGELAASFNQMSADLARANQSRRQMTADITLSLADAGELKLHLQSASLHDLLEHVAAAYRQQAEGKQIRLTAEAEPNLPEIQIDPERMEQVLGNLVGNALRYTPEGGKISMSARQARGSLTVSVSDSGSGIPPEVLPHIFERSYRGDPSRSGNESGLGLAIAKSIVELHGGIIRAESDATGACFIIKFPNPSTRHT